MANETIIKYYARYFAASPSLLQLHVRESKRVWILKRDVALLGTLRTGRRHFRKNDDTYIDTHLFDTISEALRYLSIEAEAKVRYHQSHLERAKENAEALISIYEKSVTLPDEEMVALLQKALSEEIKQQILQSRSGGTT